MDEAEFRRRLELFPVVRPRDYHVDSDPSKQSTSRFVPNQAVSEWEDAWEEDFDARGVGNLGSDLEVCLLGPFWEKLKLAAEKKMGETEAKAFCKAFQQVHKKLVYEELSLDAARRFTNASTKYASIA